MKNNLEQISEGGATVFYRNSTKSIIWYFIINISKAFCLKVVKLFYSQHRVIQLDSNGCQLLFHLSYLLCFPETIDGAVSIFFVSLLRRLATATRTGQGEGKSVIIWQIQNLEYIMRGSSVLVKTITVYLPVSTKLAQRSASTPIGLGQLLR